MEDAVVACEVTESAEEEIDVREDAHGVYGWTFATTSALAEMDGVRNVWERLFMLLFFRDSITNVQCVI